MSTYKVSRTSLEELRSTLKRNTLVKTGYNPNDSAFKVRYNMTFATVTINAASSHQFNDNLFFFVFLLFLYIAIRVH